MDKDKKSFIEFMVRSGVLIFGDFTTKSGRQTPYFVNTGSYDNGLQIGVLGGYYGEALYQKGIQNGDILFGPAYKGIPLAIAASIYLYQKHRICVGWCYNRKEEKDHGEGGNLVGTNLDVSEKKNLWIIEDVATAGTSVRETMNIMKFFSNIKVKGLVVSVDRMEKGQGNKSALVELREEFGIDTFAIVTLDDIVEYLKREDCKIKEKENLLLRIEQYRETYGAKY